MLNLTNKLISDRKIFTISKKTRAFVYRESKTSCYATPFNYRIRKRLFPISSDFFIKFLLKSTMFIIILKALILKNRLVSEATNVSVCKQSFKPSYSAPSKIFFRRRSKVLNKVLYYLWHKAVITVNINKKL